MRQKQLADLPQPTAWIKPALDQVVDDARQPCHYGKGLNEAAVAALKLLQQWESPRGILVGGRRGWNE